VAPSLPHLATRRNATCTLQISCVGHLGTSSHAEHIHVRKQYARADGIALAILLTCKPPPTPARSCQMKSIDAGGAWLAGLGNRGLGSSISGSVGVLGDAAAGGRGLRGLLAQLVGLETCERLLNLSRQLGGL